MDVPDSPLSLERGMQGLKEFDRLPLFLASAGAEAIKN
jgi:hypothetical protein